MICTQFLKISTFGFISAAKMKEKKWQTRISDWYLLVTITKYAKGGLKNLA